MTARADCPTNTNAGTEFLLTFPLGIAGIAPYDPVYGALVLMTNEEDATDFDVTVPNCQGSPFTVSPSASSPALVELCPEAQFLDDGLSSSDAWAITIVPSNNNSTPPDLEVVFKANDPNGFFDDAFLVLPTSRLGSEYWPMGYRGEVDGVHGARWAAVAETDLNLSYKDCTDSATDVDVDTNYVFQQVCLDDGGNNIAEEGTGYKVSSDDPDHHFALITGSDCVAIPTGSGTTGGGSCETLMEMMPPAEWAGSDYYVTEFNKDFQPTPAGDVVRILALVTSPFQTNDCVAVTPATGGYLNVRTADAYDCTLPTPPATCITLAPGAFCDVHIQGGARITEVSQKPILVGQFMKSTLRTGTGDPSFVLVTPTDKHTCGHRFFSFEGYPYDDETEDGTYVNIVAPTASIGGIQLDGETLSSGYTCLGYSPIAYASPSSYSWVKCLLADPPSGGEQHLIGLPTPMSPVPFAAYAYGQSYAGAYSYPTAIGFE